jgi:hypothetical protein
MIKQIVVFRKFVNAPKNWMEKMGGFMPRSPHPKKKIPQYHRTGGWIGTGSSLDSGLFGEEVKLLTMSGIDIRFP